METRHLRHSLSLSLPRLPFRNPRSQPSRFFPPLLVRRVYSSFSVTQYEICRCLDKVEEVYWVGMAKGAIT